MKPTLLPWMIFCSQRGKLIREVCLADKDRQLYAHGARLEGRHGRTAQMFRSKQQTSAQRLLSQAPIPRRGEGSHSSHSHHVVVRLGLSERKSRGVAAARRLGRWSLLLPRRLVRLLAALDRVHHVPGPQHQLIHLAQLLLNAHAINRRVVVRDGCARCTPCCFLIDEGREGCERRHTSKVRRLSE